MNIINIKYFYVRMDVVELVLLAVGLLFGTGLWCRDGELYE